MARRVRDATLETRTARGKLKARGKPYYRSLSPGLHIGYRKNAGGGRWVARIYTGSQTYHVSAFADADDVADANGASILNFWQAQQRAHELKAGLDRPAPGAEPPAAMTVANAVSAYISKRDARDSRRAGRAVRSDAARRLSRYLLGQDARGREAVIAPAQLAAVALHSLTETDLSKWRGELPGALKSATVLRLTNDLKAALNAAYRVNKADLDPSLPGKIKDGLQAPDSDDTDTADLVARENQILTSAQVGALLAAAREVDTAQDRDGDLFRLVLVLAATGARFSQVVRMRVADCQFAEGRLMIPTSRKGRARNGGLIPVPVGPDVLDALRPVVTGRPSDAQLLEHWRLRQVSGGIRWVRADRDGWQSSSELVRPWAAIRKRVGLPGSIVPYALRHSSIVRAIKANLPIRLIAASHDTSVSMIEAHYSKWITSGLDELMRQAIVPLVPTASRGNVIALKDGA